MYNPNSIIKRVVVHCNPSALDNIKSLGLDWNYSKQFGYDEVDVVVTDKDDLDDEEFINRLGLNYHQVNCIELLDII